MPPRYEPFAWPEGHRLKVRAGEVLAIAGVAGNGQGELFDALSGEYPVRQRRCAHPRTNRCGRAASMRAG
jgi:ABC-type uncharacterized transport system ATPase subunit